MAIRKAVIQVVVLFNDEDVKPSLFEGGSLAEIGYEIEGGSCLGLTTVKSIDPVPQNKLHDEQLALGNDGSFFQADEDEALSL